MKFSRSVTVTALLVLTTANAHAIALYGAYAEGSNLITGTPTLYKSEDGGVGSASAAVVNGTIFSASTTLGGPLYTPILHAASVSVNPANSDERVNASAEAYETYTSSITQTITMNLSLHGIVAQNTETSSYVLGNIKVIGGAGFMVSGSYSATCWNGTYAFANNVVGFGAYLCGTNLGSSNLYIDNGDTTLTDSITFSVNAGDSFAVYGMLTANAYGGSADASHTLAMSFVDPTHLTSSVSQVPLPAAFWLFGSGFLALVGVGRVKQARS